MKDIKIDWFMLTLIVIILCYAALSITDKITTCQLTMHAISALEDKSKHDIHAVIEGMKP